MSGTDSLLSSICALSPLNLFCSCSLISPQLRPGNSVWIKSFLSYFSGRYSSQFGQGNSSYAYFHEEDESTFHLVDSSKQQKPLFQRQVRGNLRSLRHWQSRMSSHQGFLIIHLISFNFRSIAQVPTATAQSSSSTTAKREDQRQHANLDQEPKESGERPTTTSPQMAEAIRWAMADYFRVDELFIRRINSVPYPVHSCTREIHVLPSHSGNRIEQKNQVQIKHRDASVQVIFTSTIERTNLPLSERRYFRHGKCD